MYSWAKREIELVKGNNEDDGYVNACLDSALKAFESLVDDGHSGFSIGITKSILNRLIDGEPLTPIEDTADVWSASLCASTNPDKEYITKQCVRMSSLFKYIYKDGHVKYVDVNRIVCRDINNPNLSYTSGYVRDLMDDKFPITMPYTPIGNITVYCEDFLLNKESGDFDTVGIFYAILPDGEKYEINHFIHYPKNKTTPIEIPKNIYDEYKRVSENNNKNR